MPATTRTLIHLPEPPVLYLALELSRRSWKLAFSTGLGQKPRLRSVPPAISTPSSARSLRHAAALAQHPKPAATHRPLRAASCRGKWRVMEGRQRQRPRHGPTSASWLNLVERFFSELTTRQLKRLAVTSVGELIEVITRYIDTRNEEPRPFVWTVSPQSIIAKVRKAKDTLATHH